MYLFVCQECWELFFESIQCSYCKHCYCCSIKKISDTNFATLDTNEFAAEFAAAVAAEFGKVPAGSFAAAGASAVMVMPSAPVAARAVAAMVMPSAPVAMRMPSARTAVGIPGVSREKIIKAFYGDKPEGKSVNGTNRNQESTTCPCCAKTIAQKGVLRHFRSFHPEYLTITCGICGEIFYDEWQLCHHNRHQHNNLK